jgi:methionyl-tRNA synthetase
MVQVYNADLANSWGNLCSRAFNMTNKYFDGVVPDLWDKTIAKLTEEMGNPLADLAATLYDRYATGMNAIDYSAALAAVLELCNRANLYVEESAPWNLAKEAALVTLSEAKGLEGDMRTTQDVVVVPSDATPSAPTPTDRLAFVIYNLLESIRIMAVFFAPVMPTTSAEVWNRLGLGDVFDTDDLESVSRWGGLPAGNKVTVGDPLFPRLKEDEL